MKRSLLLVMFAGMLACDNTSRAGNPRADSPSVTAHAGDVADSVVSMATLLRRFQEGLDRPARLAHTSRTRDELTRRYLRAVERSDTTALREMHITKAEYAYLYFPESRMMSPPYDLDPAVAWMLHSAESNKGIAGVLRRFGGQAIEFEEVRCDGVTLRDGASTVWRECVVHVRESGTPRTRRFVAAIIERDGAFKVFSFASAL